MNEVVIMSVRMNEESQKSLITEIFIDFRLVKYFPFKIEKII